MLNIVNSSDKSFAKNRYLFSFGAYGWTKCLVWANHLDGALDIAIDWIADNAPGLLCDEQVNEKYRAAIAEGKSEDEAFVISTQDMTRGGNCGNYIASQEWSVVENPTREMLKAIAT